MEKFQETHNWSKYCGERRKERINRLIDNGCLNPYAVVNGAKPKYINNLKVRINKEGRILIPKIVRNIMEYEINELLTLKPEDDKLIIEKVKYEDNQNR